MSILAQQLNGLKQSNLNRKIGHLQPHATLLLQVSQTKSITNDVIYSMAVIAYSKIQFYLHQHILAQFLMNEQNKDINRNKLTKKQNKSLSEKLIKFIIDISPFFLNRNCQEILQYLLRNYQIHIFEADIVTISFLHFWNTKLYVKLVSNIDVKQHKNKLFFLKQFLASDKPINLDYIVKNLSYCHQLMQNLMMVFGETIKQQHQASNNVLITLEQNGSQHKNFSRNDATKFILTVFMRMLDSNQSKYCYEYICQLCIKIIKMRQIDEQIFDY